MIGDGLTNGADPSGHEYRDCRVRSRGTATLARVIPRPPLRLVVMAHGKVDFFNDTGGYGFISTDDGDLDDDEDVFFHMEDVGGEDLTEGTEVEFDIESSPKGPRASNVVRQ
jgi:CspA family cold shock protein